MASTTEKLRHAQERLRSGLKLGYPRDDLLTILAEVVQLTAEDQLAMHEEIATNIQKMKDQLDAISGLVEKKG